TSVEQKFVSSELAGRFTGHVYHRSGAVPLRFKLSHFRRVAHNSAKPNRRPHRSNPSQPATPTPLDLPSSIRSTYALSNTIYSINLRLSAAGYLYAPRRAGVHARAWDSWRRCPGGESVGAPHSTRAVVESKAVSR